MSNHLLYQIFEAFTVVFETLIIQQYISGLFDKTQNINRIFLSYLFFCVGQIIFSLFYRQPIVLVSYTILGVFILAHFCYAGNVRTKFFLALFFGLLMVTTDIIGSGIILAWSGVNFTEMHEYSMLRIFIIITVKIIQIFTVKIFIMIVKWKTRHNDKVEVKGVLLLFLCQFLLVILLDYIFMTNYYEEENLSVSLFFVTLSILFINFMMFWYFDNLKYAYEYKHEKELIEAKFMFQNKFYELLDDHQQEVEAIWHDIKKHTMVIKDLYKNDMKTDADSYIKELEDTINSIPKIVNTPVPGINAVLTEGFRNAKKDNIDIRLDINVSKTIKFENYDLCIILGNLIENAINACLLLPPDIERYIELKILQDVSSILIETKNPYDPEICNIPRKRTKHGYGLKNVTKIVNKYGGNLDIKTTDGTFQITIIIP